MQTIDNYNFKNKKALIRVDFNVPLNEKFDFRTYITPNIELRTASNSWENSMPTGSPITNAKMPIKVFS